MCGLIFHPDISMEVKASFDWYQEKLDGLGFDFLNELENAFQAIVDFPETWPKFQKEFRRYLLSQFPFSVIYVKKIENIYVVAIMHNSRKPNYWLDRTV